MFSVNIDKLIKMTPLEAESYAKAADSLENLLADTKLGAEGTVTAKSELHKQALGV